MIEQLTAESELRSRKFTNIRTVIELSPAIAKCGDHLEDRHGGELKLANSSGHRASNLVRSVCACARASRH
jgi:hypothetical protein